MEADRAAAGGTDDLVGVRKRDPPAVALALAADPRPVWAVTDPATAALLDVLSWLGWGIALVSTFLINHFELFGLRQAFARVRGWTLPPPVFGTPFLY